MREKIIKFGIPAVLVVAAVIVLAVLFLGNKTVLVDSPDDAEFKAAYKLLNESYLSSGSHPDVYYVDFMDEKGSKIGAGEYTVDVEEGIKPDEYSAQSDYDITEQVKDYDHVIKGLEYQDKAIYKVNADKEGLYYFKVDYASVGTSMSPYTVRVRINSSYQYVEANTVVLPVYWNDEMQSGTKTFQVDQYNDEMPLVQQRVEGWYKKKALYNNTYSTATPLCFYLEKGENIIEFTNASSGGLALGQLYVVAAEDKTPDYNKYASSHSGAKKASGQIEINAINYTSKSSTDVVYDSEKNSSLAPFDIDNKKINTLKFVEAGSEAEYKFTVEETGLYNLAAHYKNKKDEFSAFVSMLIDGEIPFAEMYNYELKSTGTDWNNELLSDKDGNAYDFYLEKGEHTLSIKLEQSKVMEAYRYALLVQRHVTNFQLDITKITGADVDRNRKWKMTQYIRYENPVKDENGKERVLIVDYLNAYSTMVKKVRSLLQDYSDNGNAGAILAYLDKVETYIEDDIKYPDEIALYVDDLTGAENSILQAISKFTESLLRNDLTFDRFYFYTDDDDLPSKGQSVFMSAGIGIKELINTFISDKYSTDVKVTDPNVVTIWVNRAVTHVDLMQKMADTQFTPKTGIKVKITTMPDVNRLTMAIAANEAPDAALGLQSYVPFELASRGAVYNLTSFDDYWTVAKRFPAGSMVSYIYNEESYAIPECTDFNCIIYRTDIFDSLGIDVPKTWDDLKEILPVLQRYGKNFYHNIAQANTSYKWFFQTSPLILQNGGHLYAEDGTRTDIDSKESIKGLETLGELFTQLSVDTSVASFFNSFRYAEIPIGIGGMEDYTLIKNGAPELDGQWAISPYLGTVKEDGTVDRTFIANGTGGVIFGRNAGEAPTDKQKKAWEYLKWWTTADVQREYAYTLRATNGRTYYWLSANLEALQDVPMAEVDKQVVLEQINDVTDINRTPGQYLLERTISNIWNTIVNDNVPAQIAVDESVLEVNKEITRKMQEFGFIDENGNKIKDYVIHDRKWVQEQMDKAPAEKGE